MSLLDLNSKLLFVLQTQTTCGAHPSHHGVKVGFSLDRLILCACRLVTKLAIIIVSHIFLNSFVLIFVQCSVLGF